MKVIDLLNKMANGPILLLPKKIKFEDKQYIFEVISGKYYRVDNPYETFEEDWYISKILNEEIEIIEDTPEDSIFTLRGKPNNIRESLGLPPKTEKKIEKIDISNFPKRNNSLKKTALKVNEIIDKINGEEYE